MRNSVLLSFSLRLSFNIHERMSLTQCSILFIARNASISNDQLPQWNMVNSKGGRAAFILNSSIRLSENRISGTRWPLIKLSEFRVFIRSSAWPSSCVDSETRWVNDIDSNKSKKWQAAVLLWSSTQISKLKKRGSRDKMIGSKKSENSSTKPIIVTGLVLKGRSTIYYEKSKSWWFGRDEIVGKFKRRS